MDALAALTILGLIVAFAGPAASRVVRDARTAAAAREFAVLFRALRWRSVTENRNVGLFFERRADGWLWWEVEDGNANGLRTAEIRRGTDRRTRGPFRLRERHQGVRLALPASFPVPRIPPDSGPLTGTDPVRFGRPDLVSFGPGGGASSGTLYLTDERERLFGVRLYGASARVRVWRFDRRENRWRR